MKKEYKDCTISNIVHYLEHHNKNLTKQQDWAIQDLWEKIESLQDLLEQAYAHATELSCTIDETDDDECEASSHCDKAIDCIDMAQKIIAEV